MIDVFQLTDRFQFSSPSRDPRGWWRGRPLTRRRMIAEEQRWRKAHDIPRPRTLPSLWRHLHALAKPRKTAMTFISASAIADIYRQLRKGLEDAKNEPGAADFYYGEMEMRRLAARKPTGVEGRGGMPAWIERRLLDAYWAISGYGLRASRSITVLIAIILIAAGLFTQLQFAARTAPPARIQTVSTTTGAVTYTPDVTPKAPDLSTTLVYSARESISLLQEHTTSPIETHGLGTLVDFALRLLGPLLLAFAILALRGRTKR
jgi:hypothetical protein